MKHATINDAPPFLNTNDKAMWVLGFNAALTGAQPAPAAPSGWNLVPDWVAFDGVMNVLTIHGKQYAAPLFGINGFLAAPGTVLRIEEGLDGVVTFSKVSAAPAAPSADRAAQWLVEVRDQFRGMADQANQALTRHVADLAQPADSAMDRERLDWLTRQVSGKELRRVGVVWPAWSPEYAREAIDRARTLSAASNKESQHG